MAADVREGIVLGDLSGVESLEPGKADAVRSPGIRTAPPPTLEGIRAKHRRVDVVTLYTGKVYRGVILSRGAAAGEGEGDDDAVTSTPRPGGFLFSHRDFLAALGRIPDLKKENAGRGDRVALRGHFV